MEHQVLESLVELVVLVSMQVFSNKLHAFHTLTKHHRFAATPNKQRIIQRKENKSEHNAIFCFVSISLRQKFLNWKKNGDGQVTATTTKEKVSYR